MTEVGSTRPGFSRTRFVQWFLSGAVLVARGASAVVGHRPVVDRRRRSRRVRGRAPRRDGRGRQPGPDRKGPHRRHATAPASTGSTDLQPGTYTITFSLTGFAQVKREDVEVSGGAIISINADMRVGGVQETITVSGETPVVDVQTSTKQQTVLDDSVHRGAALDARLRQPALGGARHPAEPASTTARIRA